MTQKQVFISHISAESAIAQGLKRSLDGHFGGRLDIFVSSDRETIRAGQKWLDEVDAALKSADAELVLCSKASIGRPWVNFEAGAAWLRRIPVIPVCHSGLTLADLPAPLSMLQGVECSSVSGLQKLYDALAAVLGVPTPTVDFDALAADLRLLEEGYLAGNPGLQRIENPRILCGASAQYAAPAFGFDLDVAVLEGIFGAQRVQVERSLTRKSLTALLSTQRFDIVHLVCGVDSRSGEVIFSSFDLATGQPATPRVDKLAPQGLAALLVESRTRLVVLATCRALKLAVVLARGVNMVATEEEITGEQAEEWADCFYTLLRQGQSLHKAFDLAAAQVPTPLLLVPHKDAVLALPPA
jgi:hypothetical protein